MLYHIMLISYHVIQVAIAYSQHTQFEKGEPQMPFVHEPTQLGPSTPLKPMNAFLRLEKNAPLHMLDQRITHLCLGCVCFKIENGEYSESICRPFSSFGKFTQSMAGMCPLMWHKSHWYLTMSTPQPRRPFLGVM